VKNIESNKKEFGEVFVPPAVPSDNSGAILADDVTFSELPELPTLDAAGATEFELIFKIIQIQ